MKQYTVLRIEEDIDFGCEERSEGQSVMAVVTLRDGDGQKTEIRQVDRMLYDRDINEGDLVRINEEQELEKMRILMLGNSFIFVNDLPKLLAELTGAEVVSNTRGGARLAEHLNPDTKMGAMTQKALEEEKWDYVILQEMSNAPATAREKFLQSANVLCERIHANGATPLFYATWAYKKDSEKMNSMEFGYDEMYRLMYEAYHEAAEQNQALIADVGRAFYEKAGETELYAEDGCHPSMEGSKLAAEVIADVILQKK